MAYSEWAAGFQSFGSKQVLICKLCIIMLWSFNPDVQKHQWSERVQQRLWLLLQPTSNPGNGDSSIVQWTTSQLKIRKPVQPSHQSSNYYLSILIFWVFCKMACCHFVRLKPIKCISIKLSSNFPAMWYIMWQLNIDFCKNVTISLHACVHLYGCY